MKTKTMKQIIDFNKIKHKQNNKLETDNLSAYLILRKIIYKRIKSKRRKFTVNRRKFHYKYNQKPFQDLNNLSYEWSLSSYEFKVSDLVEFSFIDPESLKEDFYKLYLNSNSKDIRDAKNFNPKRLYAKLFFLKNMSINYNFTPEKDEDQLVFSDIRLYIIMQFNLEWTNIANNAFQNN